MNVCCMGACGHLPDNGIIAALYSFLCIKLCIAIFTSVYIHITIFVVAWLVFEILRAVTSINY